MRFNNLYSKLRYRVTGISLILAKTDLVDSGGRAAGTKVEVWIPLDDKSMEDAF
jgi:hypothetical protein